MEPIDHTATTKATLSTRLIHFLEQQPGWRLWLGLTLFCLVTVEVIVTLMDLLLNGQVTWDYLLTGLVAAGLVAPVSLAGLTHLLEATRQAKADALELQSLRASKNMKVSLDAAHMLFWELDLVSGVLAFDDSRLHWLGFVPSQAVHTLDGFLALVHPDDRALLMKPAEQPIIRPNEPGREYRVSLPDGRWAWHRTMSRVAARDAAGQPTLLAGGTLNITEQKQAQLALASSRQLLQSVIDTVPLRVFWKDPQLRYLGCNPAFARDAGLASPQELVGKLDAELVWKDYASAYAADDQEVMRTGISKLSYEELRSGPQGRQLWLRTSKVALRGAAGEVIGVLGMYEDVTAFKQAEQALRTSEDRANRLATMLRLVSDNVPDMIWAKDLNKRYLFANKAVCEQLLGVASPDEALGRDDLFFAQRAHSSHPDDPRWHSLGDAWRDSDEETLRHGKALRFEESGYLQGRFVAFDVHKAPLLNDHGQVMGVVGSARDVTAQRAAQDKLRLAALVLDNSSEAMLATDAGSHIVDINPAFTTLTGYTRADVLGRDPSMLNSGRQNAEFYQDMWRELNTKGHWQGELWNRRKNGEVYAEWLTINTIYHEDGSVHRRVALFSDVTEKKQAEELIWRQANFDGLTGLPNRRMFLDRLGQDLLKAQRSGHRLAVFFLDLDHFKEVNDTLGHETGDLLLAEAARRLSAC
ncbi:PAS domain S-box protein, partial [Rhodoferax sp. 4810]|nr:PAS domain S-box protein [Rhodoferax jenense]